MNSSLLLHVYIPFPMTVILFQSLGRRGRITSTCLHSISLCLLTFSCLYKQPLHISLPITLLSQTHSRFSLIITNGWIWLVLQLWWWDCSCLFEWNSNSIPYHQYSSQSLDSISRGYQTWSGGRSKRTSSSSSPPPRANHPTRHFVCRE